MVQATGASGGRAVEATAACRLDLAGGGLFAFPASSWPPGALSVAVAVDRRAWARAETIASGIQVESKDSLLKVTAPQASALSKDGVVGLVRRVLQELGIETGVRILTQAKVPFGAGLASAGALTVAVAAAASRAFGREVPAETLAGMASSGGSLGGEPMEPAGSLVSVQGGVAFAPLSGGTGGTPGADPARVEECLILVDPSSLSGPPVSLERGPARADERLAGPLAEMAALAEQVRAALEARRQDEVAGLLRAEHRLWEALVPGGRGEGVHRIAELAEAAGGAARLCGPGPGSLVLVWAEPGARGPGPREKALRALKAEGHRLYPCRVDLRGLEVEVLEW